jgi:hypothetical protein
MVEVLWTNMAQGIWIQQVLACVFIFFSFFWPLERYNVHNATHLLIN